MKFAYRPDGAISPVTWQISSETCRYLKINLWGEMPASFEPAQVSDRDQVISERRKTVAGRAPLKKVSELAIDFPNVQPADFAPTDLKDTSVYGVLVNGSHYRSDCPTRHGPYPFCDELVLPSYSLAKSIFGGLGYLYMVKQWPEFENMTVSELIPECHLPDGRWNDVTMSHLANMTTGNYKELTHHSDEGGSSMGVFFNAKSHSDKINFSCHAWPRKSVPGAVAVYHTTDHYLLGSAMNAFLKQNSGSLADIYRDYLFPQLLEPLKLSPLLSWTQRTYDDAAQPFTSHGLVMKPSDMARISSSINSNFQNNDLLDQIGFEQAMFRDRNKTIRWVEGRDLAYKTGFWGIEVSEQLNCATETWIPFMSGYGGISVALLPNGTVYYHFSDNNSFRFLDAAKALNKIKNICSN